MSNSRGPLLAYCLLIVAEMDVKHDPERQGSLVGVAEGLASEADAAQLGKFFGGAIRT